MPPQHAFVSIGKEVYHIDQLGMTLVVTDRKYSLTALDLPARASLSAPIRLFGPSSLPLPNSCGYAGDAAETGSSSRRANTRAADTRPSLRYGIDLLVTTCLDPVELE
ncbi:MAG: hypothetical protein WCB79_02575 [Halobacteriota archaeon]